MGDGERINEGTVPTSSVQSRLGCRGRPPPPVPGDARGRLDARATIGWHFTNPTKIDIPDGREHTAPVPRGQAACGTAAQALNGSSASPRHGSSRPSKRTRNVVQGSVLIPKLWPFFTFGRKADHLIAPPNRPEAKIISVCTDYRLGGAPRRNRTGDPILTMEPPGTAVQTTVSPGHARP
jgi:hypothetical protein